MHCTTGRIDLKPLGCGRDVVNTEPSTRLLLLGGVHRHGRGGGGGGVVGEGCCGHKGFKRKLDSIP